MCILCGEIGKNYSRTVGEMVVGKVIRWENGCQERNMLGKWLLGSNMLGK